MEQFTYIYKQGALCGTIRAARTIGPRPPAGYGYPEKTAGVPCRRRACPRSSHPARPPPPNHPACPSRDECLLRSGQILEKTRPVVLRLIWAFRPLHTTDCKQRSGRPHPPGTPTRNRAVPRRGNRKQQTERRQWQQRKPLIGCAPGHPDPESDRSTARRQKTANGAGAMEATEAADRLRTRAPRHGIGPLNGESKESGRRSGGDGSNGAAEAAEASSASETV